MQPRRQRLVTACASPKTYTLLTPGTHVFDAEAVDQAGNVGPYNEWKWTINGLAAGGQNFTIDRPRSGSCIRERDPAG